ncbi:MAG: ribosome biogenesis GTP-binding protein YsxC [Chitinispirillaceae bacterium]|nr:ribosome biogenesis GTP-binding protein YsxC [Chitinispirillaceae bacterium]
MPVQPENPRFIVSAGTLRELPHSPGAEFCLLGRSNVGKSTFINQMCGHNGLARTSKTPGKTICANLYAIYPAIFWVDLPGYGFAKTGRNEKQRWSGLIGDYCEKRRNLKGILWLVDSRHIGLDMDQEAFVWLRKLGKPVLPVLTKTDKLSRSQVTAQKAAFNTEFGLFGEPVLVAAGDLACREIFWQRFTDWTEG